MKIIISPAKNLREEYLDLGFMEEKELYFPEENKELEKYLYNKNIDEINRIWKISDKLAKESLERYRTASGNNKYRFAIELYNGAVYKNLAVEELSRDDFNYLNRNLRIISAYYGLLRPNNRILPYRLEMDSTIDFKLDNNIYKSLYEYWGNKVCDKLVAELSQDENEFIINLASKNYAKLILKHLQKDIPIYEILFYCLRKGKSKDEYKNIATIAKIQRGKILRYLTDNRVEDIDGVKEYTGDGFTYDFELSDNDKIVFVRDER